MIQLLIFGHFEILQSWKIYKGNVIYLKLFHREKKKENNIGVFN